MKIPPTPNIEDFTESIVNEQVKVAARHYDNAIKEFLIKLGYNVKEPYDTEQLKEIRKDLEDRDKFVDSVEYTEYDFKNYKAVTHCQLFLNSVSNPISEEERQEMIEEMKQSDRRKNNE